MTLDKDDIDAIADAVARRMTEDGGERIKADTACLILGINRRTLSTIARKYPEIQPAGKGSHIFSRAACVRIAAIRRGDKRKAMN